MPSPYAFLIPSRFRSKTFGSKNGDGVSKGLNMAAFPTESANNENGKEAFSQPCVFFCCALKVMAPRDEDGCDEEDVVRGEVEVQRLRGRFERGKGIFGGGVCFVYDIAGNREFIASG